LATSGWDFGWEALAALGTLTLAGVTVWLVWTTRGLAKATSTDVMAQWRPALVPGRAGQPGTPLADRPIVYDPQTARLLVSIRNAGRGPALFVRIELDPDGNSPDLWNLGALAPGDEQQLTFSGVYDFNAAKQVLCDYRDLGGRTYTSAIVLDVVREQAGDTYRYYDVRLFEGESITSHGDAVPQAGLRGLPSIEG
jgi:hypothetical protein